MSGHIQAASVWSATEMTRGGRGGGRSGTFRSTVEIAPALVVRAIKVW